MLKWDDLGHGRHRAALPVYGNVVLECWSDGEWHVNVSVPGLCDTLVAGVFSSLEGAKSAADTHVTNACRDFLGQAPTVRGVTV